MKIKLSDKDLLGIARIKMLEKKCKRLKKCKRTSYRIAGLASKILSSKKSSKLAKAIAGAALSLRGEC
ncbi:hypothetical protein [Microcoleus sp. POL10_C6]|uniref:hypothetical protein n=1 Tax=Microcoleus sp. POL10_C6 TaxID=2818852 RepID=UPI002FD2F2C7